jgi:1,5-anhydro-D-fructose reductase (1,5-anhydro-D-mannitol-forming)
MIRYGIVGFGLHAVRRMMPAFQQAKQSQAVALTRRDQQKAQENAREYNIPLVFDSAEELCASPDVDAVFVTTPNICHLNDVLTAARHGKHVLCEKPLAMNADECRRMIEATKKAGVRFGVAQVFRFANSVAHIREQAKCLGRITTARAEFSYPGHNHARTWLNNRAIGGGTIGDVGVHCIDTLRYVLQDEVVRVHASSITDQYGDIDAAAAVIIEFSRGVLATVNLSARAEYRTAIELVGDAAVLNSDYALTVDSPLQVNILRAGQIAESREFINYDAYSRMLDAFSAWIETGTAFPAPGEEGLRNQIVVDAAYQSAEMGQMVCV